jgi:polyribonucleotide nucleotidyltransferase
VKVEKSIEIGGRKLTFECGRIARQADGAVHIRYGDTVVLVTACAAKKPREGVDFMPLTVDYRENTYAAGKIPGGFFKREGRPNEKETLTSRLIDRPLRPLFPSGWDCETQVIALVLSFDQENDPDIHAVTGASLALMISDIPFSTPIGAVRMGLIDGEYVVNPTDEQQTRSRLDLIVAGTKTDIVMVEAGALEVSEAEVLQALAVGQGEIRKLVEIQEEFVREIGRAKRQVKDQSFDKDLYAKIEQAITGPLTEALAVKGKIESYKALDRVLEILQEGIPREDAEQRRQAKKIYEAILEKICRRELLGNKRRTDGRAPNEIRTITCEVGALPRTHGSAIFTRGETQALVTVTLGTSADAQRLDFIEGESKRRFMLHYNFPPFSVGEARFLRGPGRREIGHGALAERAIRPMIPAPETFPYTVRLVSDILESNGSSSMASICGGVLALMDAAVPLKAPVAGIAMGLFKEGDDYAVLSDIAGVEDHYGDMDFKIAGSREGITAVQMDIKIGGIPLTIMEQALAQAKEGRFHILDKMQETLSASRAEISAYAPRMLTVRIPKDKIRDVIGPGGKMIRSIQERTGAKIEIDDDGKVEVASIDEASARLAVEIITELTAEAEVGRTYTGKVKRIVNFGAFVEIMPGLEGLLHVSEIAPYRVAEVTDELTEGQEIQVKVIDVDGHNKVRLSRRALLTDQEGKGGAPDGRRSEPRQGSGGGPRRTEAVGAARPPRTGSDGPRGGSDGGDDSEARRRRRRRR